MNSRQMLRGYFIKEVSKKINTPIETIKQWEKDFNGLLVVPRTQQGARYYTNKEISLLNKIKKMCEQNANKEMIRSSLEKHGQNDDSELPSESLELKPLDPLTVLVPTTNVSIQPPKELNPNNIELF